MQRVHFQVRVGVFNCQQILAKISFVIFDIVIKKQIECGLACYWWNSTDLGLIDMVLINLKQKLLLVYYHSENRATSQIWKILPNMVFPPIWGKNGGVLSMRMQQVIINQGNTSSLWKTIRQALPKKSSQRPQYTRDTDVLANEFNRFFISVGQKAARKSIELANHYGLQYINPTSQVMPTSPSGEEGCFVFQPITPDDVRKVILDMHTNKAPGFDKVPISVVKDCLEHILPTLTDLINHSFWSSVFPRAWKKGEVVPHRKEGDHDVANNNRPVSLLPVLSKVAERTLCVSLTTTWHYTTDWRDIKVEIELCTQRKR